MDWRMISVIFSVFQFIFMAVIFAVLKFNDMAHIANDVTKLKEDFVSYELKNDDRHIENIKSMNTISISLSNIQGQWEEFNRNIKKEK